MEAVSVFTGYIGAFARKCDSEKAQGSGVAMTSAGIDSYQALLRDKG